MPDKVSLSCIQFHFIYIAALKERQKLKAFILSVFKKEKTAINSISYIFCSDEYLLGINQQFLQHNYYTDIITFNLAGKNEPVLGEIYISVERVRDNASTLNESATRELHRVIFHGVLHLCGYKDKRSKDAALMRKKEEECLKRYFK